MTLSMKRREFMRFAGGGVTGLATAGVTLQGISTLNAALAEEEVEVPRGPQSLALSVCSRCAGGCGLRVRKIGSRAVRITGNPLHPVNHRGLCPKGLAGLQLLYHPDRIRTPLRNTGSRSNPQWTEISWEEAIQTVVDRLRGLREKGEARSLVFVGGYADQMRNRAFQDFLQLYGSPNFYQAPSGMEANHIAAYLQQGVTEGLAFDLESTRYLLSFGAGLLEGWGSPVRNMQAFGRWRDSAAGRRTKFVQIEPRFSVSGARADEWLSLRPGTEAALALGIAYVLITEGLFDSSFVNEHTFGFEDWQDGAGRRRMGFRSLVLGEYRLNRVSEITGVPAETILRLGREFGRSRPSLAIGPTQTSTLAGDVYAAMAVHSLNALVGSLEVPGGMLLRAPLPDREGSKKAATAARPPALTSAGSLSPWPELADLPGAILSGKPYPVQALFVHGADPVFSQVNGERFAQACAQVPFLVSFASLMDDTSAMADLILPDSTDLEKWQAASAPPSFPFPMLSVSPPAVDPLHQTRDAVDVVLQIARGLGGEVAAGLPHSSFEEVLRAHAQQIFAARAGYVFSAHVEEAWNRLLERSGWWAPSFSTADELWSQMKETGGWWEPTYYHGEWERVMRTPSGRFEFHSQKLAQWFSVHPERAKAAGLPPGDDHLSLPRQIPLPEPSAEYPLLLIPFEVLPLAGATGAEIPYLQQISGMQSHEKWQSWLEMSPETAQQLGLSDMDMVWVESSRGRARVKLRVTLAVQPGVVQLPLGYGRTSGSKWARRGTNPLSLISGGQDTSTGGPAYPQSYVRVVRG